MPIVKANAYGHGLVPVAAAPGRARGPIAGRGLPGRGGGAARGRRRACPSWSWAASSATRSRIFLRHGLTLTASSIDKLKQIDAIAGAHGRHARPCTSRSTPAWSGSACTTTTRAGCSSGRRSAGTCGWRASTRTSPTRTPRISRRARLQLARFLEVLAWYDKQGVAPPVRHIANSGAVLQLRESHLDLVRPGILLYGVYPSIEVPADHSGEAGARVASRVVYFKVVTPGHPVGYGSTWQSDHPARVVTVPVGYGDGYFRALSNVAHVLDPRQALPGRGPHLHGPDHGEHRVGHRVQRRRGRPARRRRRRAASPASTWPSGPAPSPTRS